MTRRSALLPPAVGFTTGMVDVIGWLTLGQFYTANITGDLTQSTSYLLPSEPAHLLQMLAVPVFVVGLVASYTAVRRLGVDNRKTIRLMFVVQATFLLVAAIVAGAFGATPLHADAQRTLLGLLAILTICLSNTTMNIIDHGAATTWALTANTVRAGVALLNVVTRHGPPTHGPTIGAPGVRSGPRSWRSSQVAWLRWSAFITSGCKPG